MRRFRWIDVLVAVSCFAVVSLHVDGVFWNVHVRHWWLSNLIECLFYFGAPVFFMISGCTLIDYRQRYDTKTFFRKRILRTFIPFAFWSCCWLVLSGGWRASAWRIAGALLNCTPMSIYWFFVQLFACYLVIPVIGLIPEKRKWFGYVILYSIASTSFFDFASRILGHPFLPLLRNPIADGAVPFLLIGYWIGHYEIPRKYRLLLYGMGVVGFLSHLFGTYALSASAEAVSPVFKGYMNWPSAFYSSAVFCAFRYQDWSRLSAGLNFLIDQVRDCSLSIYLLHGYVVYRLCPAIGIPDDAVWFRAAGALVVVPVLIVAIRLIRKIPAAKVLLP